MVLRRFGARRARKPRSSAALQMTGERLCRRLQATVVADPADGQQVRADGSYVGGVLGNWMVSAGYVDRWWGPGWEGSLIYGSNQRPIPSLTHRAQFLGSLRAPLAGLDRPMAPGGHGRPARGQSQVTRRMRSSLACARPGSRIRGSRSACREAPSSAARADPAAFGTFWDMFIGNDNDQVLAQPAGQPDGWLRRALVVALGAGGALLPGHRRGRGQRPAQQVPRPCRVLRCWGGWGDRSWRAHIEYADTACAFYESAPQFGCAYRNSIYRDGYQFRDRVDRSCARRRQRQLAIGAVLVNSDGSSWELALQDADINRRSANSVQSVSPIAAKIRSIDVSHRRNLFGGDLRVGVGYEEQELPGVTAADGKVRGFVQWTGRTD